MLGCSKSLDPLRSSLPILAITESLNGFARLRDPTTELFLEDVRPWKGSLVPKSASLAGGRTPAPRSPPSDLGATDADDAIHISGCIIEIGHGKCVLAGGDPVPFCSGVDLEHVCPGAEDWLFPAAETEALQESDATQGQGQTGVGGCSPGCGHWSGWAGWPLKGTQRGDRSHLFVPCGRKELVSKAPGILRPSGSSR